MKTRLCWSLIFMAALIAAPLSVTGGAAQAVPAHDVTQTVEVFLPFVARDIPATCGLNEQEQQIATLMINDPGQQRTTLACHPILAQVARERAQDMVDRHYFSHTNPDGYGPNYLVSQAGYVLPAYYNTALDANNIESIAAGYTTASAAWSGWMSSSGHRRHLLGEISFFAEQVEYGIGYANGGDYGHYWVAITAKPGP